MVWLQAALVATVFSAPGDTVLLDFYADWCGPCRAMGPTIDALMQEGWTVRKVNIDRHPQLARKYGVRSVPCYVMLVDGREVDRVLGGTSFSRLRRMCALASTARRQPQSPPTALQAAVEETGAPVAIPGVESTPPLAATGQPPAEAAAAPTTPQPPPSAPDRTPQSGPGAALDAALIAASVRLRIEDADGHSCGSGTIIDARRGEALILTCAHIFRDSQGKGPIEVDLFSPRGVQRVAGNLISYDLERDVGLLSIRASGPVATARVAPPEYQIAPGKPVISVGCNNGDRPTARHSRVTSLNKYLGPPNLQVAGLPVEGRSGGGLFSGDGLVIGVCNAADPTDQEGLYAALASIHTELDQARLAFIYKSDDAGSSPQQAGSASPAALATVDPPSMPKQMPRPSDPTGPFGRARQNLPQWCGQQWVRPAATGGDAAPLSPEEQAALDEIRRRLREGAEVVCVVRSRSDPQAKSEVIILDKVSSALVGRLAAEARTQDPLLSTSLEIPRKGQPAASQPPSGDPLPSAGRTPVPPRPPQGGGASTAHGWRPSALAPRAGR